MNVKNRKQRTVKVPTSWVGYEIMGTENSTLKTVPAGIVCGACVRFWTETPTTGAACDGQRKNPGVTKTQPGIPPDRPAEIISATAKGRPIVRDLCCNSHQNVGALFVNCLTVILGVCRNETQAAVCGIGFGAAPPPCFA